MKDSSVELQCRVRGNPKPTITWHKSGRYQRSFLILFNVLILGVILRTAHRIHLADDGQILRISQIRTEDAGLYTCNAENTLQRISASTDLRVRDPSKT